MFQGRAFCSPLPRARLRPRTPLTARRLRCRERPAVFFFFFFFFSPLHGSGHQNHLSVCACVCACACLCVASCGAYKPFFFLFYKPDYTLIDAWIGAALCVYAPQPHRPGKDFLPLRAGYAEINVNRMDLIICVLGLLALIVEGIRCQGVYGECVQFFFFFFLFAFPLLKPNVIMTL